MKSNYTKLTVAFLFILSGICGLIYEVAWSRYLALFIGSTAYSHMIVLATYMGGLALGAFYWGKHSDKITNQLKLYGLLEIAIGVYCLAYPFIIELTGNLFINAASGFGGSSNQAGLLTLKFFLSFITLFVPTFLMGGTLPVLSKFFTKNITDSGKDVAVLYYINSFGAVIGTGLAGFFLIRTYGVESTVQGSAIFNISIGMAALAFSKLLKPVVQVKATKAVKTTENPYVFSKSSIQIAIYTALAAGFIAMLYELAWIRLLSNILGSTSYSFTLMLIAFISGIALGSLIVSFIIKRIKNLIAFLAICQLGTAFSMILMLPLYERLPYFLSLLSAQIPNSPENFTNFLSYEFLLCFFIMVLPTIFSGMSLPAASRIANDDIKVVGKSIGGIFSINTIGSVGGALLTGMVLIPLMGLKSTLEFGVLLNGLIGIYLLFKSEVSKRLKTGFALAFFVLALGYKILFPAWNQNFLISGVFRTLYKQEVKSYTEFKNLQNRGQKIVWHKEGVNANVAVRESQFGDTIQRSLVINGKADASTIADLPTQVLLGQIPLMLYPNSGDALVIGLGSGITCGSALCHPIKSLDVVELASEVVECNSFFTLENYNFSADPRTHILVDDAFTQLKISSKKYDYIISEPSNPWIAGISNLYSLEFFEMCKKRMNENGVLTQWFHTYNINNEIFKLVLSTISEVFPHVTIWKVTGADIIILASVKPLVVDFDAMEQKMKQETIAGDLARINMFDVPTLLSTQVISARNNPYVYSESSINSLDKSPLEFLAPKALFTNESVTVIDSLDERFSFLDKNLLFSDYEKRFPLSTENYLNIARYVSNSQIGDLAIAYSALRKVAETDTLIEEAETMLAKISAQLQLPEYSLQKDQIEQLRQMAEYYPDDNQAIFSYLNALVDYYRLANSIVNPQAMNDAVELMRTSVEKIPANRIQFQYIMAMILTGAGRYEEAIQAFLELKKFQDASPYGNSILSQTDLNFNIGECYYNAGNLTEAETYFRQLLTANPNATNAIVMLKKIELKGQGIK